MKLDPVSAPSHPLAASLAPGVYPYLGGSVPVDLLRSIVATCGGAVVPGRRGARLAATTPGVLVDPAAYGSATDRDGQPLFDYDEWLSRQQVAGVPLILTDTPRIPNDDRSALRKALARWALIDDPTLVVLPVEPWWLRRGLSCLIEEVRAAGRPVAVVLLHPYNGLDLAGAVAGLLTLIRELAPLPVVLLRSDVSVIGAVAHQAFAGFVGWSANTRHGPLPMRRPESGQERDASPSVFVPALHDYVKASSLPALARARRSDVLGCDDPVCCGESLLQITRQCEDDLQACLLLACRHNVASTERIARRVFAAAPRPAWRETCQAGGEMSAALLEDGISLPVKSWLRQWLDLGSPSHDLQAVR